MRVQSLGIEVEIKRFVKRLKALPFAMWRKRLEKHNVVNKFLRHFCEVESVFWLLCLKYIALLVTSLRIFP
jgi:hypothetical protein